MARLRLFTIGPNLSCRDFLEFLLSLIINPLWLIAILQHDFYTYLRPFRLAHFAFWHCLIGTNLFFVWILGLIISSESDFTQLIFSFVYALYFFVVFIGGCNFADAMVRDWKPKVQNLTHVILGFFGMILSVWIAFGCVLACSFKYHTLLFGSFYLLALCFFKVSYLMICNVLTHLYLILPPENQPFSGIKLHVVLFGLFHLAVGISSVFLTKVWPICCLLLLSSFVFSINAWSCFFTPSYILCEHRRYEEDMLKSPGIICHVAVRRNQRKMKDPMNLPIGFQFDDKLDVGGLQYKVLKSYRY
ncbi:unnamed protein product [Caenorhabditis nigoni]